MADEMDFEDCVLKVNETYAAKFKKRNEKVELDRLQQKYGQTTYAEVEEDDEDSETSESEDENAKELNEEKEKDFLKTLALIKNKDPQIYEKDAKFYSDDIGEEENKSQRSMKPVYLKDYEREQLLKKGSKAFVSDNSSDEDIPGKSSESLTYVEEQEELKNSFKDALSAIDKDEESFLSKRKKSKQETETENKHYSDWLKKKNLTDKDKHDLEPLWKLWSDPNLDDDEKFLRNFILQKRYIDNELDEVPTYDEVVEEFRKEEDELKEQEEFERKYNYRYEEPESAQLKNYPRTVSGSLRRKDNKRKEQREGRNERKLKEKEEKKQELKRLKNLKKKEILEKLEKLKEVTGNPNVGFNDEDLDGDFDPEKYDKAMQNVFNDDYYNEEECEKPNFQNEDVEGYEQENWDDWDGQGDEGEAPRCDDANFNMDADYEENLHKVNSRQAFEDNKTKKSTFAKALHAVKPTFDPNDKTFEEYFDEYYKLNYEDIIGDMPCRFKYRQVEPNDFGLTVDEILICDDKELNQWSSLKKAIQYRTKKEENKDLKRYRRKGKDLQKKMMILKSLSKPEEEDAEEKESIEEANEKSAEHISDQRLEEIAKKMKGNGKWRWKGKERMSAKERQELNQKRRLMRHFRGAKSEKVSQLSSSRLRSYGVDKKRKAKS